MIESCKCNPNIVNMDGSTALHVAVQKGAFKVAASILTHPECDPNIEDLSGNTPLHIAVREVMILSQFEPLLKKYNIDVSIQNSLNPV